MYDDIDLPKANGLQRGLVYLVSPTGGDSYWARLINMCAKVYTRNYGTLSVSFNARGFYVLTLDLGFFEKLSPKMQKLALCHEAGHIALRHIERLFRILSTVTDKQTKRAVIACFNIAADMADNDSVVRREPEWQEVRENNEFPWILPEEFGFPLNLAMEDYLKLLFKDLHKLHKWAKKVLDPSFKVPGRENEPKEDGEEGEQEKGDQDGQAQAPGGNSPGEAEGKGNRPSAGDGDPSGESPSPNGTPSPSGGDSGDDGGMGSEIGKLKAAAEDDPDMFDDIQKAFEKIAGKSHAQWNEAAEKATPDEAKAIADKAKHQARSLARNALESTSTQRGKLPGHIEALIASLLAPERIPWNAIFGDLLATHVTSKMQEAMNMPNGCLLNCEGFEPYPGMTLDFGFYITWIIDVSGSRSDKVFALAAAEVNQLLEKERAVHLTVLQGDAACQSEMLVSNVTPPDQEEIDKLNERNACGGTVYTPMFKRIMGCDDDSDWQTERPEEPHPTPDLILVSTDGGVVIEGEVFPRLRPNCPIIWLMDPGTQPVPGMSDVAPDRVIETFEINDND